MKIRIKYIFIFIALMVAVTLWQSLSQPGIADLPGEFTEVAMYRNENNTGPVKRIYAVAVNDTLWDAMETYGNYMPYSKLGTTTVYFFKASGPFPTKLQPGSINFSSEFNTNCLAKYEKGNMGSVSLQKYPLR
ncbi:MAG: hypothetical protein Roseis2KO_38070 [Roseivirga sp.]